MTRAPTSPPLAFRDIDDVAAAIREAGGRMSAPRRRVLEVLFAAEGPVSAEHITERGDDAQLDLASVYRTLEQLEELGVVRHVHFGHAPGLYALTGAQEKEYLACERCDRIMTVPATDLDDIRARILDAFGYRARFTHFPITGLCPRCAAREDEGDGGGDVHHHEHTHGDHAHAHPHTHEHEH